MLAGSQTNQKKPRYLGIFVLFLIIAAGGAVVLYSVINWSAAAKAKKLQNPVPATSQAVGAGMMIYMQHCEKCHGENGDGKGPKAADLSIAPQDLTNAQAMSHITDGEFFWQISEGRRPMPAFKDKLSEEMRWQVVDYIRTFAKKPSGPPPK
ncbi:MAG TPA: c-type cytochrome [Candidatus Limnocylindrales bacterium]|nr:c-type cytochrome [Candidatus Limnocylindrales bacterium]